MGQLINFLNGRYCYFLFGFNKIPFYLHYLLFGLIAYNPIEKLLKSRFKILIVFIPALVIFIKLWRNDFYFQSDDFAHLQLSRQYSYMEILRQSMGPAGMWGFHHIFLPLWLFKSVYGFFGVNFEPYSILILLLHLFNVFILYLIINRLSKNPVLSVLTAFLFSSFYLTWISCIWELTTAVFFFLSIFFWLNFLFFNKKKYWLFLLISFLLGLLCYEKTALLPISLFLIAIVYNSYITKLNLKKILYSLIPLFVISGLHFFIYGRTFLGFFKLGSNDGYSAQLSIKIIISNLLVYLNNIIPILNKSIVLFLMFLVLIIIFDIWKKRLILLPLFICYLVQISPALFLEHKIAPYYGYIPSIFIFILITIFSSEIYSNIRKIMGKKSKWLVKVFNIYFVLIILIGVFKVDRFLLDSCFLIQSPWINRNKLALESIVTKLNMMLSKGEIKEGKVIKLSKDETTYEMEYLLGTQALPIFLNDKKAFEYTFVFNKNKNLLLVKK